MRKALIVGIDQYLHLNCLSGCINDAYSVKNILERNADGTINFATPKMLIGNDKSKPITKKQLKNAVKELFEDDSDIALLYFAGHGYIEHTGGFLCAGDCETGDDGLSLVEIMTFANQSKAKNRIIILDSCHSGGIGDDINKTGFVELKEGTTILTASTKEQYAAEIEGGGAGIFTSLFVDALNGAAANLLGDVTPGSIYAHIDKSLGPWSQRPVFKTNVKTFVSLRKASEVISHSDLCALKDHFPSADYKLPLDPSFEPERSAEQEQNSDIPKPDKVNTTTFSLLQRYVKVNLVRPVDEIHMWHAAMHSKSCELTVLGQHYWKLVNKNLL
ncbi:caspase family protein [Acinetobacter sp. B5B]|uniref:caspase family protein n=1 Tax=Acinetobacter baretiae TaxID=2605383 RepID=UPI0018C27A49|nr:caspase family protein [Acinetobacter baretiae]MBF7684116.1 caspase family protein [Acinetobacter baretiae]